MRPSTLLARLSILGVVGAALAFPAAAQDKGTAWRAYRAGGVAELTETVRALGGEVHRAGT